MRHNIAHRKLGRVTEHRLALLRNQATALLRHERIETTMPKAKELRPFVERMITIAKRGVAAGDAERQGAARAAAWCWPKSPTRRSSASCSRRWRRGLPSGRAATRGSFVSDSAAAIQREVAQVELVGSEFNPRAAEEAASQKEAAKPKTKGVGDRLKAAAQRMRGGKGDQGGSKAQAGGQTKGAARKSTTPRKAGGESLANAPGATPVHTSERRCHPAAAFLFLNRLPSSP